ncbi:hypothetical protein NliqN6_5733 [Naganishia liquefaciens]|uniref:MFS transporter n=1 Tax=Naganishia liquefaciens TaxID=104408 RepID=A0A8H3TYP8_9TREE|nr:hypothetical protein NliqN6_5733 [Naganishia liquefaciens]
MGKPTFAHEHEENDGLHATLHPAEDKDAYDDAVLDKTNSASLTDYIPVGREALADKVAPSDAYEGKHLWDPEATWTKGEERKLVRKIDFWLLSVVCIMFIGLQLDRGNLGNAATDNLMNDIGITQNEYNNGSTIQLVCFMAAEFPSQMILSRVGFQRWLPFLMFAWGAVSLFQAFMKNKTEFYITRALIGLCEGGFIPGAVLYTSFFYKTGELAIRLSLFWSSLNLARVFSNLLAAAILPMRGVAGKTGWFWLFTIEGLLTCVVAIFSYLWLPVSPVDTKTFIVRKGWFSEREEIIAVNRILRDDPAKGLSSVKNAIKWKDIKEAWTDPALWGLVFIGLIAYIPQNPVQAYLNLSLKRMGYTTFQSNMLGIPSAVLQIISESALLSTKRMTEMSPPRAPVPVAMLLLSYSSDYFKERTWQVCDRLSFDPDTNLKSFVNRHCFFGEAWSLPCLIALLAIPDGGREWGRFALITLIAGYPYFHPIMTSWISENSFSVKKRSISVATYNIVVQWGAIVGSQIYRKDDVPYYHRGNKILISLCLATLAAYVLNWMWIGHLNKKKSRVWEAMSAEERFAYQDDQKAREADGNRRLDFRFSR